MKGGLMAALSENLLTVNMLLSVFFLPGIYANSCGGNTPLVIITTPKPTAALSGSCLNVPCSFTAAPGKKEFDSSKETRGAWIKDGNDIYKINNGVNKNLVNITGNLSQKNCTSLFSDIKTSQSGKYFLRIENDGYKATACSDPLQITVEDSPWSPSISISGDDLKEHQSVTITCSALTPCPHSPPELTWNLQQDSHRQTEKNTDGTFTTKIQENITLSDTHDGYNIRCSARYPVNGGNKTAETAVTLSVSYAPRNTSASIRPSGLVSAGSWVELNCSSRAKPPASFTWFRNSKHGAINVSVGQVYSFSVTEGGEFYCVATNDLGNETSSRICVGVKDSPWSPSINISGDDPKEHQSVTITCSALTPCPHSPPELTWNLHQDSHRQTEKNTDGTFTTKIQENITLSDTHDGYNIRCSARYPVNGGNKTAETAVTLSVSYAPRNTSASISPSGLVSAGSWVELNCSSRAKPPASFTWFRNSKHGAINVSVGQVYSFSVTEGGEFYCVATNDLGNETSSGISLQIKDSLNQGLMWVIISAGVTAAICLVACLVVSVWCFRSKRPTQQQTESQTTVEIYDQMSDSETKAELHYGELIILKKTPEVSFISVQDSGQQETVYAQIQAENVSTQTADNPESLYAEVKKE